MPKLHELKHARAGLVAKMRALAERDADLTDEEGSDFDALKAQVAAIDQRISRLEDVISAQADAATEIVEATGDGDGDSDSADAGDGDAGERRFHPATKGGLRMSGEPVVREEKGFKVARFMVGLVHARGGAGMAGAAAFVERRFGDKLVARALNTTTSLTGGALVPASFAAELIELLRANTVVRGGDPLVLPMPTGNMTIPRLAAGATAGYSGELDPAMVSAEQFDDLQLNAKKLRALVPVSNDLIRRAPIGVEALVRDDLVQVLARREDLAFLMGDGSQGSPIGLVNLVAAANKFQVAAFTATDNTTVLTAVAGVLGTMVLALRMAMSRMIRPTWLMSPVTRVFFSTLRDGVGAFIYRDELAAGKLLGFPVRDTQQIPTNINTGTSAAPANNGAYLMLADMADVVIADTLQVIVDASDTASYTDGGTSTSAFQSDQTVFRVVAEHDFNVRHNGSVAVATVPGWAPAGYTAFGPGASFFVQAPDTDGSAAPSTGGVNPPTGSSNPGTNTAVAPGGTLPGRP